MKKDKKELLKERLKSTGVLKNINNNDKKESPYQLTEDSLRFLKSNLLNQWMNRKDSSKFVIIDQSKIPKCSN
ncbi:MAG: hypothetical protein KC589_04660 [Nanoarchaeota archaeon]|nr:hypothetical protein [Nanoarchaeota archaeon]